MNKRNEQRLETIISETLRYAMLAAGWDMEEEDDYDQWVELVEEALENDNIST